jgi:hypothetical protein
LVTPQFFDLLYFATGRRESNKAQGEHIMGANHSGERRKSRMKRSRRNLVTQEKAAQASTKSRKKKKS